MAKADIDLPTAEIRRRFKETLYVYEQHGKVIYKQWPPKKHFLKTPGEIYNAANLAMTAPHARQMTNLEIDTATQWAGPKNGSKWTWKDVCTSALFGNLFQITDSEGNTAQGIVTLYPNIQAILECLHPSTQG